MEYSSYLLTKTPTNIIIRFIEYILMIKLNLFKIINFYHSYFLFNESFMIL